ncbi:MAG: rod shape-determining protein RodA, partial [Ginsengibacter sp.]
FGVDYVPDQSVGAQDPDEQKEEVRTKELKKAKENYNVKQSKIAIGSGGVFGKGFLKGTQTQGDFVPEQHTDFIFTSVGENFGFVGSSLVIILYLLFMLRIVFLAERQRSTFSRVYAYSVAAIIFFHVTINICMTVGLAPVIGITLPLMSYGGSSLLTFTILIFILVRLDADRQMVLR